MKSQKQITFDQVPEALGHLIQEVADLKKLVSAESKKLPKEEEEYLTPSEMAQSLKVSLVTLWNWDKKGITRPLRIGNQKRYRKSDLGKILVEFGKKDSTSL